MKVVDPETGETCPPGKPGEIAIRGPNVMLGYWNRPEETAEVVREGWFHSGDVGTVDENGYFYIVDRVKDMIVVGGLKVYPSEVERVILDFPGIADCAVVAAPDRVWGEKGIAFVVGGGQAPSEEAIRNHCRERLAAYKVPAEFSWVDELPRNPAGKVLKTRLRETAAEMWPAEQGAEPEPMPETPGPIIAELRQVHARSRERHLVGVIRDEVADLLGLKEPPGADVPLIDLGMDSLQIVNLSSRLQTKVGSAMAVPATLVFDQPTISALARHLNASIVIEEAEPARPKPAVAPPSDGATGGDDIAGMSEEEALEALRREIND